jgi:thymidylate synthase
MKEIRYRSLGETWLALLREVYYSDEIVGDDTRESLHICATFAQADYDSDPVLVRFASRENVEQMWKVFFTTESNGFGHSYRDRIRGPRGRRDLSDVIELLEREPLSKRAAIVLVGEGDGRVPCINAIHFLRRGQGLVATYFARGQDVFRKFYADAVCIFEMARRVADALGVPVDGVTGVIASAHIYLADLAAVGDVLAGADAMQGAAHPVLRVAGNGAVE